MMTRDIIHLSSSNCRWPPKTGSALLSLRVAALSICLVFPIGHWPVASSVAFAQQAPATPSSALGKADAAMSDITANVLKADGATDARQRLAFLDAARAGMTQLKSWVAADSAEAKAALSKLASAGIDADSLVSASISALQEQMKGRIADPEQRTGMRVRIMELIEALSLPELQVAALGGYAALLAKGDKLNAISLMEKAAERVDLIKDETAKNAALNTLAQTATIIEPKLSSALADKAISRMWPTRMRGYARYDLALRILAGKQIDGKPVSVAATDAIVAQSAGALKKDDLEQALLWALAINPEDSEARKKAVDNAADLALSEGKLEWMPVLATSLADNSDQEDLIEKLVKQRIEVGRGLDAAKLADYLPESALRAELDFTLATVFAKNDLKKMADASYASGNAVLADLSGPERGVAVVAAAESAINLERLDDALALVQELRAAKDGGNTIANLAKSLADADRLKDAETLLPFLQGGNDRDKAVAGIARVKAREGDIAAAKSALETIANSRDRGRVQSELARTLAKKGETDDAKSVALSIQDTEFRIEALLRLASVANDNKGNGDFDALVGEAVKVAAGEDKKDSRDKGYLKIVEALTDARKTDAAKQLVDRIADEKIKARAASMIGKRAALDGFGSEALTYLASFAGAADDETLKADVLVAAAANPAMLKFASVQSSTLKDHMLRVRTARAIAEASFRSLDVRNLGWGKGSPADYMAMQQQAPKLEAAAEAIPAAAFSDGRLTLARQKGRMSLPETYTYSDISVGAGTVRGNVPLPQPGHAAVTLANLSPYSDKFMEDLAAGNTGLSFAAEAQGIPYPRIIVIQSGVYTLGSLASELNAGDGFPLVTRENDVVTLRAPVLVAEGATLILSGQEAATYRLSATAGSFISVAGTLYVQDTTVTSWDEATGTPRYSDKEKRHVFRPYIIGWSNSRLMIGGSVLDSLGYAAPKSFGLAFSAGPKSVAQQITGARAPTGIVVDNFFHNFEYGFYSYEADDVSLVGNEYRDNVLYAIDPHDRSHRLLIALNTTYDTKAKHGIIVSREVNFSWIVGNVSHTNAGSGFMIDRNSVDNFVYANVAFDNKQDGLTLFESSCNLAVGNRFFDNKRAGIKIRNSWDVGVHENILENNAQDAIHGYISNLRASPANALRDFEFDPYLPLTTFAASGNRIHGNGGGIKVDGTSGFSLSGNDYLNQVGRLIDGDGRAMEGHMLRFNERESVLITSTVCRPKRPEAYSCRFRDAGFFNGDGQSAIFAENALTDTCTNVSNSVQYENFNGTGGRS
ncbi:right-handed parallel beta-helix repeat-containing protein [Agrobacterium tumefaciens]|uniref:Right-handed parallel beta-helix repeat-containing protein n=1 Tax=Agrobacterium tumefaciens TaxID=358 RepID=A0A4D7YMB1_AGRTU|nr:right-handed parallel beta-helix repeat-containing protein [Agrobacterium tumefaciens]QCL95538.1 right-handed parallel beta-helix repeat-containing protein [Agrobacterium tumefaciens]